MTIGVGSVPDVVGCCVALLVDLVAVTFIAALVVGGAVGVVALDGVCVETSERQQKIVSKTTTNIIGLRICSSLRTVYQKD